MLELAQKLLTLESCIGYVMFNMLVWSSFCVLRAAYRWLAGWHIIRISKLRAVIEAERKLGEYSE